MNFAEQLAYWYLRLNGFFPLGNFVLHQTEDERTSDADLLAVRFPHVAEEVGGQPTDWDKRFLEQWQIDLTKGVVALIVEVKTGRWTDADIMKGSEWKTSYAIKRIGVLPTDKAEEASLELEGKPSVKVDGYCIARLVIGIPQKTKDNAPFHFVSLEDAEDFIRNRMETLKDRKRPDRFFFAGDLIQYLAWSGKGN